MQERIIHGDLVIEADLMIKDFNYIIKGNLVVKGTVIIYNGDLIVEGDLTIYSNHRRDIYVYNGSIYAKSIIVSKTPNISITDGNITTFKDLTCMNIQCCNGDICVGGNANIGNVSCRNYLVDGYNNSFLIKAEKSVYIMEYSNNSSITAPEVFLCYGGDFNGGTITSDYFESGGHIYNCLGRYCLSETCK